MIVLKRQFSNLFAYNKHLRYYFFKNDNFQRCLLHSPVSAAHCPLGWNKPRPQLISFDTLTRSLAYTQGLSVLSSFGLLICRAQPHLHTWYTCHQPDGLHLSTPNTPPPLEILVRFSSTYSWHIENLTREVTNLTSEVTNLTSEVTNFTS